MWGANYMKRLIKVYVMVMCILILICTKLVFAQDTLQRHSLGPPYKGQISGYSDWTIPENAWAELTNYYIDEQGKIVMRPGFYCWKDSFEDANRVVIIGYSDSADPIIWPYIVGQTVTGYAPDEIHITGGGIIELGFAAGMTLTVHGAKINNGTYTISSIGATTFKVNESVSDGYMGVLFSQENILGAYEYTKQIEGGSRTYLVANTDNKIYQTTNKYGASNTDISGGLSFSDIGIPQFDIFYNLLFMANGEDNPIMYDQDNDVIQIARTTYSGAAVFEDTNEIVSDAGIYFDANGYHFRAGMDITVADSNNNDTYEIVSVDSNVIIIKNTDGTAVSLTEESDTSITLTGFAMPDSLSSSRTASFSQIESGLTVFEHDLGPDNAEIIDVEFNWEKTGFTVGSSVVVSGTVSNDGTYTISQISYGGNRERIAVSENVTNETVSYSDVTFSGSYGVTDDGNFNPTCLAGHKGRLFAGGCSELPTYLFWSRSRYATQYFYDLWRDRYGQDDGVGYFDMQDKVVALAPDFNGMLVIFCEHSIYFLRGDDPGFDILTPNQSFAFQPVPVTKATGIVGPNAWARAGNDIFFYSDDGLQQLSVVSQQGNLGLNLLSSPVNDVHKDVTEKTILERTQLVYFPDMNMLVMLFKDNYSYNRDSLVLCYNLANSSFSTWEFPYSSEPTYFFTANGFDEDPNISYVIYRAADPKYTLWYGGEDGCLYSLHKGFSYDLSYENPNDPVLSSITATKITAKLNMGQPFLEKTFQRTVFFCSPQVNYDNTSQGQVSFYKKIDDGSWSPAVTKSFDQHTEADGTLIDYYQFLDAGVAFKGGTGKAIQYKIETSGTTGRFGLEFIGVMTEWESIDYRI